MAPDLHLQERRPMHTAPTSLLSLPDETLEHIGWLLYESDNECCHCEGHTVTTNFKNYIRVSKRIYRAALAVGWRAWELSSESYERLLQHQDHKPIVRCVRHLHLPWVDNRTLGAGLQPPAQQPLYLEDDSGHIFVAQPDPETPASAPAPDAPATDNEREEQITSQAQTEPESTSQYDQALSECIDLFERLESINIAFCDWTMPAQQESMSIPTTLLRARAKPWLPSTIFSSVYHFRSITKLSFSGIRSEEDQILVVKALDEHPRLHTHLQTLSLIYRFDYLLFSVSLVPAEEDSVDNFVDSKPLWTAIGKLEQLHSLTIAYMPQREYDADTMWGPKVFKPKLKKICLEEVALSQGVVKSLLENRQGLQSLVAGPHLIYGIRELQATSEQPITFPRLSTLELSLNRGADAFDALSVFTHAPVKHLAITTSEPLPFLQQFPEHKARQKTVEVLALHEIYGEEEDGRMNDGQKDEWIQKYEDLGIKLCIE